MVEIYNEQVRDLLSNDGSQKKYPSFSVSSFDFIYDLRNVYISVLISFLHFVYWHGLLILDSPSSY